MTGPDLRGAGRRRPGTLETICTARVEVETFSWAQREGLRIVQEDAERCVQRFLIEVDMEGGGHLIDCLTPLRPFGGDNPALTRRTNGKKIRVLNATHNI